MTDRETVLDVVAENLGVTLDEFQSRVSEENEDLENATELLNQSVNAGDLVEADGRYWIMRNGKYAFTEYDRDTN